MENHIIIEPACKIREIARNTLFGNWKPVVLVLFIYFLLTNGVGLILDQFFTYTYNVQTGIYGQALPYKITYGSSIYNLLISGPFTFGLTMYLLTFFRSRRSDGTLLFEGFSNFGKTFLLFLLMSIKIFLWSLLFVIPGIIASIRYSQAFYVMVDHPEYSANQCLEESKRLMMGNKGRYFYLTLTFIGWYLLASMPSAIFTQVSGSGIGNVIFIIILNIPALFVDAYINMAYTAFYELATEKLVVVQPGSGIDPSNVVSANYTVDENPQQTAPVSQDIQEKEQNETTQREAKQSDAVVMSAQNEPETAVQTEVSGQNAETSAQSQETADDGIQNAQEAPQNVASSRETQATAAKEQEDAQAAKEAAKDAKEEARYLAEEQKYDDTERK